LKIAARQISFTFLVVCCLAGCPAGKLDEAALLAKLSEKAGSDTGGANAPDQAAADAAQTDDISDETTGDAAGQELAPGDLAPEDAPEDANEVAPPEDAQDAGPAADDTTTDLALPSDGPGDTGPGDAAEVTEPGDATTTLDAQVPDAGAADIGPADTGPADTGPADIGPADIGPADTGVPPVGCPTDCNDQNACSVDSCGPDGKCNNIITVGLVCSDLSLCTTEDACDATGVCKGKAVDCDDGNDCTAEPACDGAKGCEHTPLSGTECAATSGGCYTGGGTCVGGVCGAGSSALWVQAVGEATGDELNAVTVAAGYTWVGGFTKSSALNASNGENAFVATLDGAKLEVFDTWGAAGPPFSPESERVTRLVPDQDKTGVLAVGAVLTEGGTSQGFVSHLRGKPSKATLWTAKLGEQYATAADDVMPYGGPNDVAVACGSTYVPALDGFMAAVWWVDLKGASVGVPALPGANLDLIAPSAVRRCRIGSGGALLVLDATDAKKQAQVMVLPYSPGAKSIEGPGTVLGMGPGTKVIDLIQNQGGDWGVLGRSEGQNGAWKYWYAPIQQDGSSAGPAVELPAGLPGDIRAAVAVPGFWSEGPSLLLAGHDAATNSGFVGRTDAGFATSWTKTFAGEGYCVLNAIQADSVGRPVAVGRTSKDWDWAGSARPFAAVVDAFGNADCGVSGACYSKTFNACSNAGPCHKVGCNAGACVYTPVPDATPCDDQTACTANDVCTAGECGGSMTCASPPPNDGCTLNVCNKKVSASNCVQGGKVYSYSMKYGASTSIHVVGPGPGGKAVAGGSVVTDFAPDAPIAWLHLVDSSQPLEPPQASGASSLGASDLLGGSLGDTKGVLIGTAIAPGGDTDGYVALLEFSGKGQVVKTFGGGGNDEFRTAQVLSDGSVAAGGRWTLATSTPKQSFPWVARVGPDGNVAWQKVIPNKGSGRIEASAMAYDKLFFAGQRAPKELTFDPKVSEPVQAWLVEVDPKDGAVVWSKNYGAEVGLGTYDSTFHGMAQHNDLLLLAGETQSSSGTPTAMVICTDLTGSLQWKQVFTDSPGVLHAILALADGGYAAVGWKQYAWQTDGSRNGLFVRMDQDGRPRALRNITDSQKDADLFALTTFGTNRFITGGQEREPGGGVLKGFFAELDAFGNSHCGDSGSCADAAVGKCGAAKPCEISTCKQGNCVLEPVEPGTPCNHSGGTCKGPKGEVLKCQ